MPRALSYVLLAAAAGCAATTAIADARQPAHRPALFARENLLAWCIVPFDARQRGPDARAEMLHKLGFKRFAYDYRAQHIPTFEAEIAALRKRGIELTAWWFPTTLNDEAKHILSVLERHKVRTQLWVTGGGEPTRSPDEQRARVQAEAARIRPIADAAARIGCTVGLYNHGGWFGEPENLLALLRELDRPNVGLVYNLHHGHAHLERFEELLPKMLPHLYAINLNGMVADGDRTGRKILPIGAGDLDLALLRTIQNSGYRGPIGILNHTDFDAEARLRDNLNGLEWLVRQLEGQSAGPRPEFETWKESAAPAAPGGLPAALPYDPQLVAEALAGSAAEGDARRGMLVFGSAKFACLSCHKVGAHGGSVGPELTAIGKDRKPEQIVESLFWPQREVKPEFLAHTVLTIDGRSQRGYKVREDEVLLVLRDPSTGAVTELPKADIEDRREAGTLMPDGLMSAMTAQQRHDLVRFLTELGTAQGLPLEAVNAVLAHAQTHGPAPFPVDRRPLVPEDWPHWQHHINRDRLYDFYARQADFFRRQQVQPSLLPEFPGLDGGKLGHWGNQTEDTWADGRWNDTILGSVQCGVFRGGEVTVPRGVCVRLGGAGELAACFNPDTLTYDALWSGGFVKFSPVRHGFLHGLLMEGKPLPRPEGKKPEGPFLYRGFYRYGPRVVFAYRIGEVDYLDAPWAAGGRFERVVAPVSEHPLKQVVLGGPPQWPQWIETRGKLGTGAPYALDTIPLPFENPWKALLFCGGHAFFPDGTGLVCTMQGDVWRVRGLDETLEHVRWNRFAAGLHHALGLVIADDGVYVQGRDQITRLHDLNGDGEADFYECFSNAFETSAAGHDFICGLERDAAGHFYTASGNQGLLRISADGKRAEVLATGFRNPDGLGLTPDGLVTVPCSEGEWTPASMICAIRPRGPSSPANAAASSGGAGVGAAPPPFFGYGGPRNGQVPELPLVYLPRGLDNSSGGQTYVESDRWGPLRGQMVHFSFGAGSHFLLLRDEVDGQLQGAAVPLVGEFLSGAHRGRFHPRDGQLYVTGMAGWGSYTPDDGCFHRVRFTGRHAQLPIGFHVHQNGVVLQFSEPLDPAIAREPRSHFAQCWNYRYSAGYGSPEYSSRQAGMRGHDTLPIRSAHVLQDGRSLFLELPDLQPVNQLHLQVRVDDGRPHDLFLTVHRLDAPFTSFPGYEPVEKSIAPHPLLLDLARTAKAVPNPWSKKLPNARPITLQTGKNLTFEQRSFTVRAGEPIMFTLKNPDVVPHNWALLRPGTLERVGQLANRLIADPEAVARHYIPQTDDVLVYTDVVGPHDQFTIHFQAPRQPGRYPYLCTFPGHWMVMNGEMIVE